MEPKSRQPPVPPIPFHRRLSAPGPLVTGAVAPAVAGAVTTDDGRVIVEFAPWIATALAIVALGLGVSGGLHESPGPALPDGTSAAFLVVEPGDVLLPTDAGNLSASIERAASDASACVPDLPTDDGLVVALDSRHPGIREAAVRSVRAGGERLHPKATARLGRPTRPHRVGR